MPNDHPSSEVPSAEDAVSLEDRQAGLHAPPELRGLKKIWWWFHFIVLVNLARLRFVAILALIGLVVTQWDLLMSYYDRWTRPDLTSAQTASDVEYFCPMHPSIIRDNAKEKCPICFMPLSKRKRGSNTAEPLPAGVVNRVQLSPYRVVLAGIQTFPVEYRPLVKEISAVGYIEFNERGQRTVSARAAGRIDTLFANETGKMVNAGDPLASLYSPDLVVTVENLLAAQRANNAQLLASARTRLDRLGIGADQVDEILSAGQANTHLKIESPISGHVITKYVREGQYVEEGTPLYDLADLSTVWIQAQIYEDDIAFLPAGYEHGGVPREGEALDVTATTRAFPNEQFHGKLAFIFPHVDQYTRTITVRFELDNPGHKLRPGSTATVVLKVKPEAVPVLADNLTAPEAVEMLHAGKVLAVPDGAVIDTGKQRIVYRQSSPGVYEGVEVTLGPPMSDEAGATFFPVLTGLEPGEAVVTSGSFLVDAETRLNPAAGSIYFGGSSGAQGAASTATVRPSTPEDPEAQIAAALAKLLPADRALAEAQRFCPILTDSRLGSMGPPIKLDVAGQPVFVCCKVCIKQALADPQATLKQVAAHRGRAADDNAPGAQP
ncbi:MAG: efflux RND transporter periplasmic adaptor subunit [Pirellulales bacterium]|nr:efflux RND transporter periplasmic adaptor subunit [Pirellulales bacterium]